MDSLYENFKKGVPIMDLILHMVWKSEVTNVTDVLPDSISNSFEDYDSIKGYLTVHLLNMERNTDFLKGKMFVPFLDLAVAINFVIEQREGTFGTMPIPAWMFEKWGVTKETLLNDAVENTMKRFPPQTMLVADMVRSIIKSLSKEDDDEFAQYMNEPETDVEDFFIVTNKHGFRGASVILYPHFLAEFAKEKNADRLILFPSSLHEMFVIPYADNISLEKCNQIIQSVNEEAIEPGKFLGDHAYLYDLQSDSITIWGEEKAE